MNKREAEGFSMTTLKYRNKIVREDGYCFRSHLELRRYQELKLLLHMKLIRNLKVHTRYTLTVNGVKVAVYEDDFSYDDMTSHCHIIEDCKAEPTRTDAYKMKKALMKALYGIDIVEIE